MTPSPTSGPSWDHLYEISAAQEGHFTTAQAAEAGYSTQLLNKHLKSGKICRVRRAVYRITHDPAGEHEDLVVLWLWTDRAGVFSHDTALALHDLSDLLPSRAHIKIEATDRTWHGCVPVTTPARTLRDCAANHLAPELLGQALREGQERGLFRSEHLAAVHEQLARFERSRR